MQWNDEERAIRGALSQIDTPECDIAGAVRRGREGTASARLRRFPRAALIAACLALALTAGAAAVIGVSANWGYFFGGNPVPTAAVTTVGVGQTAGDYTLTLEDAVVDDNGAVLLLALARTDGGQIEPEARFNGFTDRARLLADGEDFGASSGFQDRRLSEDGRVLHLVFEARDDRMLPGESIRGKTLTFRTGDLLLELWDPAEYAGGRELKVSLAPLAEGDLDSVEGPWDKEPGDRAAMGERIAAQGISLPLPLDDRFPQYRIRGAVMTERGLSVAISTQTARSGDLSCAGIWAGELVDTRNGARYAFSEGSGVKLPDGTHVMVDSFADCPLGLEDLPYLELELSYEMDRVLSDQSFALDFTAESGASVILPLDETVTVGGEPFHLDELRLSALNLSVGITDGEERYECFSGDPPVLTMEDGSTLALAWHGGVARFDQEAREYDGTNVVSFSAQREDGSRVFFDLDRIASVTFGDLTVPIP